MMGWTRPTASSRQIGGGVVDGRDGRPGRDSLTVDTGSNACLALNV
jgi:hypothetical protein